MKENSIYPILVIIVFLSVSLFILSNLACGVESLGLKDTIASRIDLVNKIIRDPGEACMKNWLLLGNPNDEIELSFYKNSISDGTKSAYDRSSATREKILKHSRSESKDEPSIVLQYLRLSLMAYNVRPGDEPTVFKLNSFNRLNLNEIIAECYLIVNNASGRRIKKAAKIIFELGGNLQNDIYLQKIYIGDRLIYGWWYKMN